MTLPSDFVRLGEDGKNFTCASLGLDWPPPDLLAVNGVSYELQSHSQLSDADMVELTNIARGAQYIPVK